MDLTIDESFDEPVAPVSVDVSTSRVASQSRHTRRHPNEVPSLPPEEGNLEDEDATTEDEVSVTAQRSPPPTASPQPEDSQLTRTASKKKTPLPTEDDVDST
jgi:hypothetical protein